jgi:hypothetical protein
MFAFAAAIDPAIRELSETYDIVAYADDIIIKQGLHKKD